MAPCDEHILPARSCTYACRYDLHTLIYIYISLSLSRAPSVHNQNVFTYLYIYTDIMLYMYICVYIQLHSYLYRLYLRTIDIPAIPPEFIAHLLTHLLAAVLGHSLEFLLLLRGHPVVLRSFWMDIHWLGKETLRKPYFSHLQSTSPFIMFFTLNDLFIYSYHLISLIFQDSTLQTAMHIPFQRIVQ